MSNVYNTRFEIRLNDSEEAKYIYSEIDRMVFQPGNHPKAGSLEDLVIGADLGDVSDFKTLGNVYLVGCGPDSVTVIAYSDNEPPFDVIRAFVNKYCPEATVIYYAKNTSIGLFETNNPDYAKLYVVLAGRHSFWGYEDGVVRCIADKYGKDSDVLKGFMDGCFNEDGSIDCKKANEYFAAVEKLPDDLYVTSIHKWKITNLF